MIAAWKLGLGFGALGWLGGLVFLAGVTPGAVAVLRGALRCGYAMVVFGGVCEPAARCVKCR